MPEPCEKHQLKYVIVVMKRSTKFKLVPLEVSGHYKETEIQTIALSLVPEPATLELMSRVSDELADAIEVIKTAVQEAARSAPTFGLAEATVSLNVGVAKDGKLSVIIGGSMESVTTHTVKLILKPGS